MRDSLDLAVELIQIIAFSHKRQVLFEQFQQETDKPLPGLRPLCPTRWTVKTSRAFESSQLHRTRCQEERPLEYWPSCRSSPPPLASTLPTSCLERLSCCPLASKGSQLHVKTQKDRLTSAYISSRTNALTMHFQTSWPWPKKRRETVATSL